jgi:hypothetical protein
VVVDDRDGVTKLLVLSPAALVCKGVPPLAAVYHKNVEAVTLLADKLTVPVPHTDEAVAVGAIGNVFMVAITEVRGVLSQLLAVVKVT